MHRGEEPAKAKVSAKPSVARSPRAAAGGKVRELENSLAEALDQQAATSEILRVISRSPTDVQPVFDTIAKSAARLCDAQFCHVFRFDGKLIHFEAHHGLAPEGEEAARRAYPMAPGQGSAAARSILNGAVAHIPDVHADPDYAHRAHATIMTFRSIVAVPMLRDGVPIGSIAVARTQAGLFPDRQIALLQTFADQAVIAIENVRLFTQLDARNRDISEALERQTATGEVLKVISRSAFDLQPVFATVAESAVRLCEAERAFIYQFDGELLRMVAAHNASPELREYVQRNPIAPGRHSASARVALERRTVHIHDAQADPEYTYGIHVDPIKTMLGVPMLKGEDLVGVILIYRLEVKPFTDKQIELIETFADQAVIAIENVRLFKDLQTRNHELTEALEQQMATSEILRVISQSQTDVQPVFDTIAASALSLCGASSANVFTFDGELIHLAALVNVNPNYADNLRAVFPRSPSRDTAATRAILTCSVVAVPDVVEDAEYAIGSQSLAGGFRSVLAVPLVREGSPIGVIAVGRPEPGHFPDNQVALLQTFADQAVIAIENVRLFTELEFRNHDLTEALEQQTATGEILRVISRSQTDVQPVFDAIARNSVALCGSLFANVFQFDGELIHWVSSDRYASGAVEMLRSAYPMRPSLSQVSGRVILAKAVVRMENALADPDYDHRFAHAGGWRRMLGIPLLREGNPIGVIVVGWAETGPIPKAQEELLKTFADQAVIAIENVRLFTELEARTSQLTRSVGELKALGEVGQAVSSTLDLETVLSTIVSRATELAGMDGGAIYEYDEYREEFYLRAAERYPAELIEALRAMPIVKGEGALGRLAVSSEPVQIRDIADESVYQSRVREILLRLGYRSLLAVPLLREDRLLGGLVVNRKSAGEFAPEAIDLLKTFASQSALAIQNARLFREIEDKGRQLETASRHKSEFLANMSHELRTPLNAIIGFSEVLYERMFGEINDKQAEYLADILESGRHLLSLINDILDLSKIEAGRMELEPTEFNLAGAIENTLTLVRERAYRRGITLERTLDPRLSTIRADERKVKQVLLNLLSNALKFTPEGGRVDVRADLRTDVTEISVTDTGVGIAPEDQEAVFEEFRQVGAANKKVEGTGLGLAISRKFIELHGGRIWVTSQVGTGSAFAFTLPLASGRNYS
jgi:GAF domain-containing protein